MTGSTYAPQTWEDVQASKVQPDVIGIKGTANANSTTNIDTQVADDVLIRGIQPIINGMNFGDTITISIIDKDGIYFPANTVVSTPVQNYNVETSSQDQKEYKSAAPFKMLGGLYLRIAYTNTNALVAATVEVNFEFLKVLI